MDLEDRLKSTAEGAGNVASNVTKAGTDYVKREFWSHVRDGLWEGLCTIAGAVYGYGTAIASNFASVYAPLYGAIAGGIGGKIVGKVTSLIPNIYHNVKSHFTLVKDAVGGGEKKDAGGYHGAPQLAGAH